MSYESKVLLKIDPYYVGALKLLTCCASCPLASWSREGAGKEDKTAEVVGYCKEFYRETWRSRINDKTSTLETKPKTDCDSREQALELLNQDD